MEPIVCGVAERELVAIPKRTPSASLRATDKTNRTMNASSRLSGYHKTVDAGARQKARANASMQLARSRRAEMMSKRRAAPVAAAPAAAAEASAESVTAGLPADLSMDHLPQYMAGELISMAANHFESSLIRNDLRVQHQPVQTSISVIRDPLLIVAIVFATLAGLYQPAR